MFFTSPPPKKCSLSARIIGGGVTEIRALAEFKLLFFKDGFPNNFNLLISILLLISLFSGNKIGGTEDIKEYFLDEPVEEIVFV